MTQSSCPRTKLEQIEDLLGVYKLGNYWTFGNPSGHYFDYKRLKSDILKIIHDSPTTARN